MAKHPAWPSVRVLYLRHYCTQAFSQEFGGCGGCALFMRSYNFPSASRVRESISNSISPSSFSWEELVSRLLTSHVPDASRIKVLWGRLNWGWVLTFWPVSRLIISTARVRVLPSSSLIPSAITAFSNAPIDRFFGAEAFLLPPAGFFAAPTDPVNLLFPPSEPVTAALDLLFELAAFFFLGFFSLWNLVLSSTQSSLEDGDHRLLDLHHCEIWLLGI